MLVGCAPVKCEGFAIHSFIIAEDSRKKLLFSKWCLVKDSWGCHFLHREFSSQGKENFIFCLEKLLSLCLVEFLGFFFFLPFFYENNFIFVENHLALI